MDDETAQNNPTLAVHAETLRLGVSLSSLEAACVAEAVLAASGLREELAEARQRARGFDSYGNMMAEMLKTTRARLDAVRAERDALREELAEATRERLTFSNRLGFGDGVTEPAASLNDMVDAIEDAFSAAHDHAECPIICELCGETLARTICEHCGGGGANASLSEASGAWAECEWCGGAGKIHEGCAEKGYAHLVEERDALQAKLDAIREAWDESVGWANFGDMVRSILDSAPSVSLDAVKQQHRTSAANCRKSTHGEPISSGNVCEACRETEGQS